MKIEGVGEIWEGFLERDPLNDTFHLRVTHEDRVAHIDIQRMLEAYVGLEIRVAVSSLDSLRQILERLGPAVDGLEAVSLEDVQQLLAQRQD